MTECNEVITNMDNVSTKKTNIIGTKTENVLSTVSIKCRIKKVRDWHTLHRLLLAIILLLLVIIICYYYAKQNINWKTMNLKKFVLRIIRFIILMT